MFMCFAPGMDATARGAAGQSSQQTGQADELIITATPIRRFSRALPARKKFGRLEFIGALRLESGDKRFGGWSGIMIGDQGSRLLAVSDTGNWFSAKLAYEDERLANISDAQLGPLRALSGEKLRRRKDVDAEAVRMLSGTLTRGRVLVAFERNQRVGIFPVQDGRLSKPVQYLARPVDGRKMTSNRGLEAVALISAGPHKGQVIAFAENLMLTPGQHTGWIWSSGYGKPPRAFSLADRDGFDITDAVSLPNGRLIILERRFRWTEGVRMRLRELDAADIRPGAFLTGETILSADMTYEIDNMEGLAAHTTKSGKTVLTVISDDNFNRTLQRTLLMQFILHPPK